MLLNLSCQEDFNPKTDFKEQYVLDCYVDLDYDYYESTTVYATVSKLYNVDGLDPSQVKINPSVTGAQIYFYYKGDTYLLKEDAYAMPKRPPKPYKFYYYQKLKYIYANYPASIKAIMPDGKVLTAQIKLLEGLQLGFSYNFFKGFTTRINRFLFGNSFTIDWGYTEGRLFFPQLLISYYRTDGGYTSYYKEVPCKYVNRNGSYEPIYPSYTSKDSISYDFSAIDSTMAQIVRSENFDNFTGSLVFQMLEMDEPLSKYFESTHGALDSYSISLDESVYSNIKGGIGIFGSKRTLEHYWGFDPAYMIGFLKKK